MYKMSKNLQKLALFNEHAHNHFKNSIIEFSLSGPHGINNAL